MKKGSMDFNPYLLAIVGLVIFGLLGSQLYLTVTKKEEKIGDIQIGILEAYDQETQILTFMQLNSRYAMERSMKTFLRRGGLSDVKECGVIGEYVRWNTNNISCFNVNFFENFYAYLNKELNSEIEFFNEKHETQILKDNYEFYIDEQSVAGIAITPAEIPIWLSPGKVIGEFLGVTTYEHSDVGYLMGRDYIKPSFHLKYKSKLAKFNVIKDFFERVSRECKNLNKIKVKNCIRDQITITKDITITYSEGSDEYYLFELDPKVEKPKYEEYSTTKIAYYVPSTKVIA